LIDPELGPTDFIDDLNDVFDLQVIPGREKYVDKVNCYKCKKQFFEAYKYCPHCGKNNKLYKQEDK
jgi:predicted amidophosphoribosyltransferase